MDLTNAIVKARFSAARPQKVRLHRGGALRVELLCLEAGQEMKVAGGERVYYVVSGSAVVTADGEAGTVPAGHLAAAGPGESHAIANPGPQRLLCLAMSAES